MLFKDFIKVVPMLKTYGFFVKWHKEPEHKTKFFTYKKFSDKYDFKKIQVLKCERHFCYSADFDFELTLKQLD